MSDSIRPGAVVFGTIAMGIEGLYLVPSDLANLEFLWLWGLGCGRRGCCHTQTSLHWAIRVLFLAQEKCACHLPWQRELKPSLWQPSGRSGSPGGCLRIPVAAGVGLAMLRAGGGAPHPVSTWGWLGHRARATRHAGSLDEDLQQLPCCWFLRHV